MAQDEDTWIPLGLAAWGVAERADRLRAERGTLLIVPLVKPDLAASTTTSAASLPNQSFAVTSPSHMTTMRSRYGCFGIRPAS